MVSYVILLGHSTSLLLSKKKDQNWRWHDGPVGPEDVDGLAGDDGVPQVPLGPPGVVQGGPDTKGTRQLKQIAFILSNSNNQIIL